MVSCLDLLTEKNFYEGTILDVDRARLESKAIRDIFDELAPIPKTRLPLGAVGAALVSGAPVRDALTTGYADFVRRDDARRAAAEKGTGSCILSTRISTI